jgi:DNA-binding response OmpR family regulator
VKLLVVDSDCEMVEMLTGWLKTHGYSVDYALTADRARVAWMEHRPDLVLLDTALKGGDALALCRDLRCQHDALVLAMAADRDVGEEVRCLESGVDAYLIKPFFPRQLLAYIHSLTRRVRTTLARRPNPVIAIGPLRVDSMHNEARLHDKVARLTPTESRLLHLLALNAGDVCSLDQIVAHVWGYGDTGDTYLVKAHVRHLREKIEPVPSKPRFIRTVPGVGYTLVHANTNEPHSTAGVSTTAPRILAQNLSVVAVS